MARPNGQKPAVEAEAEFIAAARREATVLNRIASTAQPPPDIIPGYAIVREIGRGGMGVIYEAQQQEPSRAVALKVMRSGGTLNKHRLMLFRQEVETLARLNCPNIAPIYGAGSTDDGRPYFAMELVRGVPVTEYVHLTQLPLREQLQLFRKVVEGVQYAHQRGVIHRDLKPSNIIVDADGNPKILDFGLAQIADADEAMRTMFAEAGKVVGTLPYMSPEQIAGRQSEIDVRSDVYSLGVILYELLTDRLPYDVTGAGREAARRAICDELPRRPSSISRTLRGELEMIVLKALEKDPAQRYQSAAALAADIERTLTNRAIEAHPPSAAYSFRKWVARHRALSAYAATLILLAAGLGIWASNQAAEAARRQREQLQRNADVAEWRRKEQSRHRRELDVVQEIQRFWERAVTSLGPDSDGGNVTVRALLDEAAGRVETELRNQPEAAAAVHETLGRAYAGAGLAEPAERQLRASLALRRSLPESDLRAVTDTLEQLTNLLLARRDYVAAESVLRQSIDAWREARGEGHWQIADLESRLGACLTRLGRYEEAEPLLVQRYAELEDVLGTTDIHTRKALDRIVSLYKAWGKPSQAAEWRARRPAAPPDTGG